MRLWPPIAFALLLSTTLTAAAQNGAGLVSTSDDGVRLDLPPVTGLNFVVSSNNQYDDANGWSSQLSPLLTYRMNQHLSFDTGLPVYLSVNAQVNKGTKAAPVYVPVTAHGVIGDTGLSGHLSFESTALNYSLTASGAFPTGNSKDNLSANAKTYAIVNHLERSYGIFTPDVEIGIGNSSSLSGTKVKKAYVAVGSLGLFQVGSSIDLPNTFNVDFELYENLPLGNQNIYGTVVTKKGKTKTVLQGKGVAEDNGFDATVAMQPSPHIGVSAFFNRSFREFDNTTGFALTYTLRVPQPPISR